MPGVERGSQAFVQGAPGLLDLVLDGHDLVERHAGPALVAGPLPGAFLLCLATLPLWNDGALPAVRLPAEQGRVEGAHLGWVLAAAAAASEAFEVAEVALSLRGGIQ